MGSDQCLYKDRSSLVNGQITNLAQTYFDEGAQVEVPGSSELVTTEADQSQSVIIDSSSFDSKGNLNLNQLLDKKLKEDIDKSKNSTATTKLKTPPKNTTAPALA